MRPQPDFFRCYRWCYTVFDLAAGNVYHQLGELGGVAGAFGAVLWHAGIIAVAFKRAPSSTRSSVTQKLLGATFEGWDGPKTLNSFYERPILNSPYRAPESHHPLDQNGQPLEGEPRQGRRPSRFIVPVPASSGGHRIERLGGFDGSAGMVTPPERLDGRLRGVKLGGFCGRASENRIGPRPAGPDQRGRFQIAVGVAPAALKAAQRHCEHRLEVLPRVQRTSTSRISAMPGTQ
jgi:hypothetical protein